MKPISLVPRRLREYRIDDASPDSLLADGDDIDPDLPVEHVGRIKTFRESQVQFRRIGDGVPADLLLIDVNFDKDPTDPFVNYGRRPLGLLYGLCFVVAGKVQHRPFGFAFHTADSGIWKDQKTQPAMQDLTVLLVAMCAALTSGDGSLEPFAAGDIDRAIEWLSRRPEEDGAEVTSSKHRRTPANPNEGRLLAADRFRRSLQALADPNNVASSRLVIDPTNYVQLLAACDELAKLPEGTSVSRHELLQSLGVLVFIDGKADCFAVDGLFPNVERGLLAEDFRPVPPPVQVGPRKKKVEASSKCTPPLQTWRYDGVTGQRPLVADYLHSLGHWRDVYESARDAALRFGSGEEQHNLSINRIIADRDFAANVKRFLALAFGIVRQHKTAWEEWSLKWTTPVLVPWEMRKNDDRTAHMPPAAKPLRQWLKNLLEIIRGASVNGAVADEWEIARRLVKKSWEHVWSDWRIRSEDINCSDIVKQYLSEAVAAANEQAANPGKKQIMKTRPIPNLMLEVGKRIVSMTSKQKYVLSDNLEGEDLKGGLAALLTKVLSGGSLLVGVNFKGDKYAAKRLSRRWLEQDMTGGLLNTSVLSDWLLGHLNLLQGIDYVDELRDYRGRFWKLKDGWHDIVSCLTPRQPEQFRPDWLSSSGLRMSAGFARGNTHGFVRIEQALNVPNGTLGNMADGHTNAPAWLTRLCVQYAHDPKSRFVDRDGWPEFMQHIEYVT